MRPVTIGVLSYQGTVMEHIQALSKLEGVTPMEVKTLPALQAVDGLILPGGESTTIAKLLDIFELMEPLRKRILQGMPVWGTCAGEILLAKEIVGEQHHLAVMDLTVRRNAYGRQIDSFTEYAPIHGISETPVELVFIRAPWIEAVGEKAQVICRVNGHAVAARQDNMLATSFHPEFTHDLTVHRWFAKEVERHKYDDPFLNN